MVWNEDMSVLEAEKKLERKGYRVVGVVRDGRTTYFPRISYQIKKGDKLLLIKEK